MDIDDAYLWDTKVRKNIELDIRDISVEPDSPSDSDWDDEITTSLEGLNVVVHDPDNKFVIEEVYK